MLYYIVFEYKDGGKSGMGYSVIHRNTKINTLRDINELMETIKEKNEVEQVLIINWQRLKGV